VAGTIQDYDRGVIIGEKSFGKGLVQLSRPLSYNSQVKITTAKYYTPTGRCIQVLDYSHRREDGSVDHIPDSLKKEFKTTHGRTVYDGGGIDPDIAIKTQEAATITQVFLANGFLFEYASLYASKHPSIVPAREFRLSDEEYQDFVSWMKTKEYHYRSKVETELALLIEDVKKEHYYADLKSQLDQIHGRLAESRKGDLNNFKDQIKLLLEQEIVTHYYLQKGAVETGFKTDEEVKKAIEVLNNPAVYKQLLNVK
jgi:carboxyl-terminal processing protease